jgi:hypothetical protein
MYKYIFWILFVILLLLLADQFVFTLNDYQIKLSPELLKASETSELTIEVFKKNILGFKIPFSQADIDYRIEEGNNLIILETVSSNSARVKSRGKEGEAIIGIYSKKTGIMIKKISIIIKPRDLA